MKAYEIVDLLLGLDDSSYEDVQLAKTEAAAETIIYSVLRTHGLKAARKEVTKAATKIRAGGIADDLDFQLAPLADEDLPPLTLIGLSK